MKNITLKTLAFVATSLVASVAMPFSAQAEAQLVPVSIASDDARTVVNNASLQAINHLQDGALSEIEARELLEFLDVDAVARFTLGRYGRGMDQDQFDRFKSAFEMYAVEQLQTHLAGFSGADVQIVDAIERRPGDYVVKTEVRNPTNGVQKMNWRVIERNGRLKVVDVEAMGFWFAIEQREQFASTLDRNGGNVDGLIEKLNH